MRNIPNSSQCLPPPWMLRLAAHQKCLGGMTGAKLLCWLHWSVMLHPVPHVLRAGQQLLAALIQYHHSPRVPKWCFPCCQRDPADLPALQRYGAAPAAARFCRLAAGPHRALHCQTCLLPPHQPRIVRALLRMVTGLLLRWVDAEAGISVVCGQLVPGDAGCRCRKAARLAAGHELPLPP